MVTAELGLEVRRPAGLLVREAVPDAEPQEAEHQKGVEHAANRGAGLESLRVDLLADRVRRGEARWEDPRAKM